jgi:formate hydrogenlyase subunit 3/multisubunit Na+/H+ antiporter MnhD subunit
MATGVIALAVPLSTSFAGEFLILAGVFQQGWGWAVVGAVAIVLAAMYMLRAISAVLHREVGPAVPDSALDLRVGELAVVVPLLACLIGLSAWPNLITHRAFGGQGTAGWTTYSASATGRTIRITSCGPEAFGTVCRTATGTVAVTLPDGTRAVR